MKKKFTQIKIHQCAKVIECQYLRNSVLFKSGIRLTAWVTSVKPFCLRLPNFHEHINSFKNSCVNVQSRQSVLKKN